MTWYYLSFADGNRPEGQQFLGALIIEADNPIEATVRSHAIGQNPGGGVVFMRCTNIPPAQWRERLLDKDELIAMGEEMVALGLAKKSGIRRIRGPG